MPNGLTAHWLSGVLEKPITRVKLEQIGEGAGMMSELSRVHVFYGDDTPANSYIAKYASQNKTNRDVAMSFNLYEREVRYFKELDSITAAKSPATVISKIQGDNFIILMADLHDYQVGDQIIGADLHQTELAIDELVKLHGSFWNKVDNLAWIPGIAESYHADNMLNFSDPAWDQMLGVFGEFVPADIANMKGAFRKALPSLQARLRQKPDTLIHGDFRMENLLFGTQPGHDPIAIIDWQGPLLGNGLVDVCLILGQSTQTDIRQAHERELLNRYASGLAAMGITYNQNIWEDYRYTHLYNWVYAAVVAGTLDASNERAYAWMSQMIKRQVATTLDLELLELLPLSN